MLSKGGPIRQVTVLQDDGSPEGITNKKKMDAILCKQNKAIDHQTENFSQLLSKKSIALLGNYGEGPRVVDVLLGNLDFPHSYDEHTLDFLKCFQ